MPEKIKNVETEILYEEKYVLKKAYYDYVRRNGEVEKQDRQVYDHGNGVTVLMYNKERNTVILTRQCRIASFINGNASGMLIECCAGILEEGNPTEGIRKEIEEETGYDIDDVKKVMEIYMSPGANTELIHFYVAEYNQNQKVSKGGGLEDEQEEIEVLEFPFEAAMKMVETGEIKDAKTVILLQYAKINRLL